MRNITFVNIVQICQYSNTKFYNRGYHVGSVGQIYNIYKNKNDMLLFANTFFSLKSI